MNNMTNFKDEYARHSEAIIFEVEAESFNDISQVFTFHKQWLACLEERFEDKDTRKHAFGIFSDLEDISRCYLEEGYSKPKISCSYTDSKLRYLLEVTTTPKQADEVISVIDLYNPIYSDKVKIKAAWRTTAFVEPESAVLTNRSAFEVLSIIKRSSQPIYYQKTIESADKVSFSVLVMLDLGEF